MSSSFTASRRSSSSWKRTFRARYETRFSRWSTARTWASISSKVMAEPPLCEPPLSATPYHAIKLLGKKGQKRQKDTKKYPAIPAIPTLPPAYLDLGFCSRRSFPLGLLRLLCYRLCCLLLRPQIRRCFLPGSCRLHDLLSYGGHRASRQRLVRRNPVFCSIRPCIQPVFPEVSYRELLKT